MIEIIGVVSTVIAIIGVLANNRRLRWCFLLWLISKAMSMAIHVDTGIWYLAVRDAVFFVMAVEGWFLWGNKKGKGI